MGMEHEEAGHITYTGSRERRGWCSAHFLLSTTLEPPALSDDSPQLNLFGNALTDVPGGVSPR